MTEETPSNLVKRAGTPSTHCQQWYHSLQLWMLPRRHKEDDTIRLYPWRICVHTPCIEQTLQCQAVEQLMWHVPEAQACRCYSLLGFDAQYCCDVKHGHHKWEEHADWYCTILSCLLRIPSMFSTSLKILISTRSRGSEIISCTPYAESYKSLL